MKQPTFPALAIAALSLGATLGLAAPRRTQHAAAAAPTAAATKPLGRPGRGDAVSIMGAEPVMPHDPNTHPECAWWFDNDGSVSCSRIFQIYAITGRNFAYWNPSVTSTCGGLKTGFAYCVEGPDAPAETGPTSTAATSTTSTSSGPTTTKPPSNGIETPSPVQEGMVGNCDKFYFVPSGESCNDVLRKHGLSVSQLFAWNKAVNEDCSGMWANVWVCVGVVGGTPATTASPTTTKPGNGISTPTPAQEGMVGNCNKFYFVPTGESCSDVLSKHSLSVSQLFAWNKAVKADCSGMWANVWVCVGVVGGTPATSARPTTTKPGNGIKTPTPTHPGIVGNCDKFYNIPKGESCSAVLSKHGITLAQFFAWNSGVKSDCSGMWANVWACVSVVGHTPPPTTTAKGNGVSTPTPIQTGMVKNCKTFHKIVKGQNCDSIAKQFRITVANFIKWNPAAKSDCSGLWANTWACVGLV